MAKYLLILVLLAVTVAVIYAGKLKDKQIAKNTVEREPNGQPGDSTAGNASASGCVSPPSASAKRRSSRPSSSAGESHQSRLATLFSFGMKDSKEKKRRFEEDRRKFLEEKRRFEEEREQLARDQEQLTRDRHQLEIDRETFNAKQAELEVGTARLDEERTQIGRDRVEVDVRRTALDDESRRLGDQRAAVSAAERRLAADEQSVREARAQLDADRAAVEEQRQKTGADLTEITQLRAQLVETERDLKAREQQLAYDKEVLANNQRAYGLTRLELQDIRDRNNGRIVIQPSDKEIAAKTLLLSYNVVEDEYRRPNGDEPKINGWRTLAYESVNMDRHKEKDWKVRYLARESGSNQLGVLSWRIALYKVTAICATVRFPYPALFWEGRAQVTVCHGPELTRCQILGEDGRVTVPNLSGSPYLVIRAELTGSSGKAAHQHAQLFRSAFKASKNESTSEPNNLNISITFA